MNEKMIKVNGIDICTESFGNSNDPAVLLIMGATASMVWWDAEFCRRLADKGRFVIRYDNRDVGRSVCYEPGNPQYTLDDMADDAVGVLDAYQIDQAHFAGMSLGGMIAQIVALRHPDRVLTLSIMMSKGFGPESPDIAPMDQRILDFHAKGVSIDWSDEQTVINYMASGWGLLSGSKHPFDEKQAIAMATLEAKRANNLLSMFNHALLQGGESYFGRINEIKKPTLVIHGTEDKVLPYEHGVAAANEIPNARLVTLEGIGHEIPKGEWDTIINHITKQTVAV